MGARCPRHDCPLDVGTDGNGRTVVTCIKCERRRHGRCIDCSGRPKTPKSWRCRRCEGKHRYRRQVQRAEPKTCRLDGCDNPVAKRSKRQYCCDRHARDAKNARWRKRYWTVTREHRLETGRTYRRTAHGRRKCALYKRKGRQDGTWGYRSREAYLKAMAKQNAKRRDRHSLWAHVHQTRFVGTGRQPHCATCGDEVPWNGRYRPKKYCPKCRPAWDRRKELVST